MTRLSGLLSSLSGGISMARPKKSISAEQVVKLARLGLTVTEIAEFLGVDRATLYRRFATEITKGQSLLNIKLRRLQLRAAERGNVAMLIFLGKVVLHQREFPDEQERSEEHTS